MQTHVQVQSPSNRCMLRRRTQKEFSPGRKSTLQVPTIICSYVIIVSCLLKKMFLFQVLQVFPNFYKPSKALRFSLIVGFRRHPCRPECFPYFPAIPWVRYHTGQVQEKIRCPCLYRKSPVTLALTLTSAFTASETCLQPVPVQGWVVQHKAPTSLCVVPLSLARKPHCHCILSQAVSPEIPCSIYLQCLSHVPSFASAPDTLLQVSAPLLLARITIACPSFSFTEHELSHMLSDLTLSGVCLTPFYLRVLTGSSSGAFYPHHTSFLTGAPQESISPIFMLCHLLTQTLQSLGNATRSSPSKCLRKGNLSRQ